MRRREFIGLLGGAAAIWPLTVRAQQQMPVVTSLGTAKPDDFANEFGSLWQQAQDLGAPMVAVQRAIQISRQPIFPKKDAAAR